MLKTIFSTGLRLATLGSRYALLLVLARELSAEEVGIFGLIGATVGFWVMVVGFDYYVFCQREILGAQQREWGNILKEQLLVFLITYSVTIPLGLLFLADRVLSAKQVLFCLAILPLEHLVQEVSRLMVVWGRPLTAGTVLFLKGGAWIWIFIGLVYLGGERPTLSTVLAMWLGGSGVAFLVVVVLVLRTAPSILVAAIDTKRLSEGLKTAAFSLVGTLCLRGIVTFDRFAVKASGDGELLGVYVFFSGIVFAIPALLESGVFAFNFPQLLSAGRKNRLLQLQDGVTALYGKVMVSLVAMSIVISATSYGFVKHLNNPLFERKFDIFWLLLLGIWFQSLSMVPHYGLYGLGAYRAIVASHIMTFGVFAISLWIYLATLSASGVPLAVVTSFFVLWVAKAKAYNIISREARKRTMGD